MDSTLSYYTGIIEAEGYFHFHHKDSTRSSPYIEVFMTDYDVIEDLKEHLGGSYTEIHRINKTSGLRWRIWGNNAISLAQQIYPLLGLRRQQDVLNIVRPWTKQHKIELCFSHVPQVVGNMAWAAGVIDGDGCITKEGYITIRIQDLDVLERIKLVFVINNQIYKDKETPNRRTLYRLTVARKSDLECIYPQLLPYLHQRKANLVKEFGYVQYPQ